ncbi:MAG: hypothetical protein K2Q32_00785 [Alphaproteobacteria bacterium]|nr:hypothetical protein [Alphaproteobacteria bacterium]
MADCIQTERQKLEKLRSAESDQRMAAADARLAAEQAKSAEVKVCTAQLTAAIAKDPADVGKALGAAGLKSTADITRDNVCNVARKLPQRQAAAN